MLGQIRHRNQGDRAPTSARLVEWAFPRTRDRKPKSPDLQVERHPVRAAVDSRVGKVHAAQPGPVFWGAHCGPAPCLPKQPGSRFARPTTPRQTQNGPNYGYRQKQPETGEQYPAAGSEEDQDVAPGRRSGAHHSMIDGAPRGPPPGARPGGERADSQGYPASGSTPRARHHPGAAPPPPRAGWHPQVLQTPGPGYQGRSRGEVIIQQVLIQRSANYFVGILDFCVLS
jgi:hypothetical protein